MADCAGCGEKGHMFLQSPPSRSCIPGEAQSSVQEMASFGGSVGVALRNRSVARNVNREGSARQVTRTQACEACPWRGPCWGAGRQPWWPCRGSRSWQNKSCILADSAEQAGTDSLGLIMCLLPRISSLSPGWENGRGQPLSSPQA